MSNEEWKITEIWAIEDALKNQAEWGHLFEIQLPPPDFKNFREREKYDIAGHLLVGDLVIDENSTTFLETHPFPEWVVQLDLPGKKFGSAFVIFGKVPQKLIKRWASKPWETRVKQTAKQVQKLTASDLFAIQYHIGINIKVPANVPHYFLSACVGEDTFPYMQVFEPTIPLLNDVLGGPTAYHNLPSRVKV